MALNENILRGLAQLKDDYGLEFNLNPSEDDSREELLNTLGELSSVCNVLVNDIEEEFENE